MSDSETPAATQAAAETDAANTEGPNPASSEGAEGTAADSPDTEGTAADSEGSAASERAAAETAAADPAEREDERGADGNRRKSRFGTPGEPFQRHSPFYLGFFGALGALIAIMLVNAITATRGVLVLIVVSFFLAVGLDPLVRWLVRRGLRRGIAVAIVALGFLGAIAIFVVSLVPVVSEQIQALIDNVPTWIEDARRNRTLLDLDERYNVFDRIESTLTSGDLANQVFGGALGVGAFVVSAVFNAFVIFVLTLYFLSSLPTIRNAFLQLAPESRRERVQHLTDAVLDQTGGYVIGAIGIATCAGVSTAIFLTIAGMGEYAIALALVVGLLDFIPMIGATIGAVIVSIIGFATSVGIGIACIIFFFVYQQVENYIVYPRIMSKSMSIPAVVTVVAALLGGSLMGVPGALLAIPVAAAIIFLAREVLVPRQAQK